MLSILNTAAAAVVDASDTSLNPCLPAISKTISEQRQHPALKAATAASEQTAQPAAKASTRATDTDSDWKVIGDGVWEEDLMSYFSDVPTGLFWTVPIEQSLTDPGKYRLAPYAVEGNPVAKIMSTTDPTYIILDATDPGKVIVTDYNLYNTFHFSQLVKENDWAQNASDDAYGVLADNIISFAPGSFALYVKNSGSGWQIACDNGFKIYLPGVTRKDYACKVNITSTCADDDKLSFSVSAGADVASMKVLIYKGEATGSETIYQIVATSTGSMTVKPDTKISFTPPAENGHSRYTVVVAALDDAGNVVSGDTDYFYGLANDPDQWKTVGTATFDEFVLAGSYTDYEREIISAPLQQNTTDKSLYRIVNPYNGHSMSQILKPDGHNHDHYIYINIDDPEMCYIIDSPIGIDLTGDAALCTYAHFYLKNNISPDLIKQNGYGGKLVDKTITFDSSDILYAEKEYADGLWAPFSPGSTMTIMLNIDESGITSPTLDSTDDGTDLFYNLNGQRVNNPTPGQILLHRHGNVTHKTIAK